MTPIVIATCNRLAQELADYGQLPPGTSTEQVVQVCTTKLNCNEPTRPGLENAIPMPKRRASQGTNIDLPKTEPIVATGDERCMKLARQSVQGWFHNVSPEKEVKKPEMSWIEGQTSTEQCTTKCDESRLANKIDEETWKSCLEDCYLGRENKEYKKRLDDIDRHQKERRSLNVWGKFAFKIGYDASHYHALYRDSFLNWNTEKHEKDFTPAPYLDAVIDKSWQHGVRLALTTEPGFSRWPNSNVLFKATLLDVTLYNSVPDLPFANIGYNPKNYKDGICEDCDDKKLSVSSAASERVTVADVEWLIPFYERNYFEVGFSYVKKDMLWWKNSNPLIMLPGNIHIGLNWQFHGTSITVSDPVLDVEGMAYMLSSYAFLGLRSEFALVNAYQKEKAAEFCSQVSTSCREYEVAKHFPLGQPEWNVSGYESGIGNVQSTETNGSIKLAAIVQGEERWGYGALTYQSYVDFYPQWQKLEGVAIVGGHVFLGRAMDFSVEGSARLLRSYGDSYNVRLPYSGYGLNIMGGLSIKPSQFF